MIFYNNLLAKWFLGKERNKSHYFMFGGFSLPDISIWKFGKTWSYGFMQGSFGSAFF